MPLATVIVPLFTIPGSALVFVVGLAPSGTVHPAETVTVLGKKFVPFTLFNTIVLKGVPLQVIVEFSTLLLS